MRNSDNFRHKQWKVQKVEIWWATFVQKIHYPLAKTEDLSNITLNYFCEHSLNSRRPFWNHKSFFTTQLLCIFLAQILHTFHKSSPTKCKFSDFRLLELKFTIFLMSFLKPRVTIQCYEITFLYFFILIFICCRQK